MDLKKRLFDSFTEKSHIAYDRDGNPLHVWNAIRGAIVTGHDIPNWCRAYLLEVSTRLLGTIDPSTVDMAVKSAIGIDGNHVKTYPRAHHRTSKQRCYDRVNDLIRNEGTTPGDAILLVSEELCLAPSTVRNAYYEVKKKVDSLFARA